ncbi:hypothetical protein, partial [Geoglobus sp.]
MKRLTFLFFSLVSLSVWFSAGCLQGEGELPAIKVVFSHHVVSNNTHLVKIEHVGEAVITKDEAPEKIYVNPPSPGIHVFAYVFK